MKLNPQSTIHFRSSSVVPCRSDEGFGELKSVRLNPRHLGSGLPAEGADCAKLREETPLNSTAMEAVMVVLIKLRRFIWSAFFITPFMPKYVPGKTAESRQLN